MSASPLSRSEPLLSVSGLAVARGGVAVLSDLGFSVAPGRALILRGPNGVGKTTLLRTLAGLQPALAGTIHGGGEGAAYASHADGVKAQLTVTENLRFWADLHGTRLDPNVLRAFALDGLQDRLGATLSAGQKRRLGLARLAVTGRRVLLLDEPTVSLDADSVAAFARWLTEDHLGQGGAAVIATHIDLGLEAPVLDLSPFRARADMAETGSDAAFL